MPNNLPMLGAVANGGVSSWDRAYHRCFSGFKRGNSRMHPDKVGQRRELRRMEQAELRAEIDAELAVTDDDFSLLDAMPGDYTVAFDAWLLDAQDDNGCSCRRCLLHDDPGGCLVIEAEIDALHAEGLAILALMADVEAREFAQDLFDGNVDGDGFASHDAPTMRNLPFDPDDIAWGFTIKSAR